MTVFAKNQSGMQNIIKRSFVCTNQERSFSKNEKNKTTRKKNTGPLVNFSSSFYMRSYGSCLKCSFFGAHS